jgi:hypothetical protein
VVERPKPPEGLQEAGSALWSAIHAAAGDEFELDERESAVLALAARQLDDLAGLEAELRRTGLWVEGSTGQRRLNPLVSEVRQARLTVNRLLGSIALPDGDVAERRTASSLRASRAASSLWAQRDQRNQRAAASRARGRSA